MHRRSCHLCHLNLRLFSPCIEGPVEIDSSYTMIGKVWVVDSCYATGWHRNRGTRSRTVVRKNEKRKRKNVGERKSRTPVMPRAGMRIEEPGQGPWWERMKKEKRKKGKEEWRRKEVADSCYASGWHENRGTLSTTVVRKWKKKRKNGGETKSRTSVMPHGGTGDVAPGRGPWS